MVVRKAAYLQHTIAKSYVAAATKAAASPFRQLLVQRVNPLHQRLPSRVISDGCSLQQADEHGPVCTVPVTCRQRMKLSLFNTTSNENYTIMLTKQYLCMKKEPHRKGTVKGCMQHAFKGTARQAGQTHDSEKWVAFVSCISGCQHSTQALQWYAHAAAVHGKPVLTTD